MISHINDDFRECFARLPEEIKKKTKIAFQQFSEDPYYPSLHFKQVHQTKPVFSVRVTDYYRVVGLREGDAMLWYWVGPHSEYERIIKNP